MAQDADQNKYDQKLGFGNYMLKQVYEMVVGFGSLIGGAYVGLVGAKAIFKNDPVMDAAKWEKGLHGFTKIPGLAKPFSSRHGYIALGGAFVGSIMGGMVLGYGHWKKEKQAQMQVDEITKNVSDIELFQKTDPELKAENERLWAKIHEREKASGGASAGMLAKGEKSWGSHVRENAEQAAQTERSAG